MVRRARLRPRRDSGQATIEYVLLIATVVSFYLIVLRGLGRIGVSSRVAGPITGEFARAYRYGHPKAKGPDDGGPDLHPRFLGGNNFRIFLNPDRP
jgi:hypothetical protein